MIDNIIKESLIMSEKIIQISPTMIKGVEYNTEFPTESVNLTGSPEFKIITFPDKPLEGCVDVIFTAKDTDGDRVMIRIHTRTAVRVNSFIDNFDNFIGENYLTPIMLSVNEKIRQVSSAVGMTIRIENFPFKYNGEV